MQFETNYMKIIILVIIITITTSISIVSLNQGYVGNKINLK